jgi:hypothetical protein
VSDRPLPLFGMSEDVLMTMIAGEYEYADHIAKRMDRKTVDGKPLDARSLGGALRALEKYRLVRQHYRRRSPSQWVLTDLGVEEQNLRKAR